MKKLPFSIIAGVLLLACAGAKSCGGEDPVNPVPDASTGGMGPAAGGNPSTGGDASQGGSGGFDAGPYFTPCQQACANLAKLGCPESQTTCVAMCSLHTSDNRFTQNLDCRINAKSKADAQKCGPSSCR
jgi:hypothetical protein